jgi:hypothetical protein
LVDRDFVGPAEQRGEFAGVVHGVRGGLSTGWPIF